MAKYSKPEHIFIQGKVSWMRHKVPNKWNKWSVTIHPNDEGLNVIRDLQAEGLKNMIKKDQDGYYTSFARPVTKETASGKILSFTPPELFDKDGKTPLDVNVGNGSDATIKIEVYSHQTPGGGKAKAARWESARIDNLIPYEASRDQDEQTKALSSGLSEQPEQLF